MFSIFQHVHRQILGDHIYAAVDAAKRGDYTSGNSCFHIKKYFS